MDTIGSGGGAGGGGGGRGGGARGGGGGAVLVTGASGGIGGAVARRLAAEFPGSPLVLGYRSTEPVALADELSVAGRAAECVRLAPGTGPGDDDEVARSIDGIGTRHGGIRVLAHCAGPHVPMVHLSRIAPAEMRRQLDDDAAGFFSIVHPALPHLRSAGGNIVAVTTAATACVRWISSSVSLPV